MIRTYVKDALGLAVRVSEIRRARAVQRCLCGACRIHPQVLILRAT